MTRCPLCDHSSPWLRRIGLLIGRNEAATDYWQDGYFILPDSFASSLDKPLPLALLARPLTRWRQSHTHTHTHTHCHSRAHTYATRNTMPRYEGRNEAATDYWQDGYFILPDSFASSQDTRATACSPRSLTSLTHAYALCQSICYEYNFCSLKERNEVQHISMGYHALAWLTEDTSIHALKRQMTWGDVCEAPPAHKTPVTTVISQFLRSSPR